MAGALAKRTSVSASSAGGVQRRAHGRTEGGRLVGGRDGGREGERIKPLFSVGVRVDTGGIGSRVQLRRTPRPSLLYPLGREGAGWSDLKGVRLPYPSRVRALYMYDPRQVRAPPPPFSARPGCA